MNFCVLFASFNIKLVLLNTKICLQLFLLTVLCDSLSLSATVLLMAGLQAAAFTVVVVLKVCS